ncbi:MAG: DNA polymerase III subunit delta', partial [Planctomycetota bacterium]
MAFEGFTNQERAIGLLKAELESGWVPHAHLFVGPGGVGRRDLARRMAAILLCQEHESDQCDNCKSCHAFSTGNHPDYFEIGVPDGRQSLPISSIRGGDSGGSRGLQEEASLKPVLSGRRVFVVRDAERMTVEAANCFLKTLEEPPGESYFILIASGLQEIPDTIISRCRLIKMSGLPVRNVAAT